MSTTSTSEYARSTADTQDYEPFIVGGEAVGEVHWARTEGTEGATLAVGLWRSQAQSFPYPFTADETIHALQGELVIDLESGDQVTLRPGDIASFTEGTLSTWTVTSPFKKFFVISGRALTVDHVLHGQVDRRRTQPRRRNPRIVRADRSRCAVRQDLSANARVGGC